MIYRGNAGKRAMLLLGTVLLAGCGGGGGGSSSNNGIGSSGSSSGGEQSYGALTSRIVGTAQPPVISNGAAAGVTGIAGASVTSLVQNRTITAPTLAAHTKIAYWAADSANGYYQIYTVPAGGGTATQITTGNTNKSNPTWSPDGTKLAYYAPDSAGIYQIYTVPAAGGTPAQITSGNQDKFNPTWSPDGTKLAYQAYIAGINHIFTVPAGGGAATQLTAGEPGKIAPSWSPFLTSPKAVTLIGAGGLLGGAAAGFLFAQSGDDVLSVLTFDTGAATNASRAGGRVAAFTPVDTENPNLVFTITAPDSLKSLKFVNFDGASAPGKVIVPALPSGTTGALVSFNAATGKVTTVLPYAANRGVGTPQVSRQGSTLAVQGRFLAVFDEAGENQAPQGASEVQIDARTGDLLAFR